MQHDEILISDEKFMIFPLLNEVIQKNKRVGNNLKD